MHEIEVESSKEDSCKDQSTCQEPDVQYESTGSEKNDEDSNGSYEHSRSLSAKVCSESDLLEGLL